MKIEPEIILPYEDLPDSNNEIIKSLKIIQNTVKYYGSVIRERQISLEDLKRKMIELEEPYSTFEQGKGFSKEDISKIFTKKMTIIFIVRNSDSVYIMIIDLYRFRFDRENVDWIPNIIYLYCTEILEEIDYPEDCSEEYDYEPMDIDNYYLDQEYWFEGDD